jgi:hypothetical protein
MIKTYQTAKVQPIFTYMNSNYLILLCIFFVLSGFSVFAQEEVVESDTSEFDIFRDTQEGYSLIKDMPLTLDMEREIELSEEAKEARKRAEKRRKRKVFYGIKTKKSFARRGVGEKAQLEIFHYLKEPLPVDPYVPEIWWFDFKRKRVRNTGYQPAPKAAILHGPYKKIVGEQVIEEGIFYKGTKHGRWTEYSRSDILLDKQKYYKGWPKDSKVRYYDDKQTKLKEVIPMVYGQKHGTYFYYHENGMVAVKGQYKEGVKVGKWIEYYPFRSRRKKEIQYPSDPYDAGYQPFISREWNRSNTLIYEAKF